MAYRPEKIGDILTLFKPRDHLSIPLATGQPMALMNALSDRTDWERLEIFTGLLSFPYPILMNPNVYVTSGYYGPIERYLNAQGFHMNYFPSDFTGFEIYALKKPSRVVATTLSPPDADGYLTFGTHAAAIVKPFLAACRNPDQIAIAEINARMPIVYGDPSEDDNKVHLSELTHYFETDQTPAELPKTEPSDVENRIADHVQGLIRSGETLQFGIGAIADQVASHLAAGNLGDFGVHSELISDGFLKMLEAGKISNRHKKNFPGRSVFTFALGSQPLYDFLDERNGKNRRHAIALPVSTVNDPHVIAQNPDVTSINSGFRIDFSGQVCSEAIGLRQYSGVGGQLSFVQGAYASPGGKSLMCLKSTTTVDGRTISNIHATLPVGSLVSTPRHYVQYVVTEYGVANLYGASDEERAERLIAIAHPNFRGELETSLEEMKRIYYRG